MLREEKDAQMVSEPIGRTCYERLRLSSAVARALQEVYTAKTERDRAAEKQDSARWDIALKNAREVELRAAALDQNRKEHRC